MNKKYGEIYGPDITGKLRGMKAENETKRKRRVVNVI